MGFDQDLGEARKATIWQTVVNNALRFPDKVAYVQLDDDRRRYSLTYTEVVERATRLSEGLVRIGVRHGDRVAIWMTNRPEWIISYFAAMRLGAVLVPLNTWLTPSEMGYLLRQSEARHLIVLDRFRRIDFVDSIAQIAPELTTASPGALWSPEVPDLRNVIVFQRSGKRSHENHYQWSELAAGDPTFAAAAEAMCQGVLGSNLAMIKYTSGSTGRPKGVMLEHGGVVVYGKVHSERIGVTPDDVFFSAMPFFHGGGSLWGIQTMQAAGGRLVFTEAFDPPLIGELIEAERCTVLFGILANELVTSALQAGRDFSSVRMSRPGGRDAAELMPKVSQLINPFGLTECYAAASLTGPDDSQEKQRSTAGRPLRGNEIKAVDPETGIEVPPGTPGEAWVRGNTMRGYWKNPEATAAAFAEGGWLRSEDLITIDDEGYVRFVGRLKLMIKVGGENVSVEEVERVLRQHEGVFECVVVGVPDQRKIEIGRAYVVRHEKSELDEDTLLEWSKTRLARFKIPRDVVFVDSLPVLGNAKFDRLKIQQLALEDAPVTAGDRQGR